jgi:hypothetical protein
MQKYDFFHVAQYFNGLEQGYNVKYLLNVGEHRPVLVFISQKT